MSNLGISIKENIYELDLNLGVLPLIMV